MSKPKKTQANGRTFLPADKLVSSVGIGLLALCYRLGNIDPNDWYAEWKEVVSELEVYSSLLSVLHQATEEALEGWVIELPANIVAVTAPNPFYNHKKPTPSREQDGIDISDLGDLPF